MCNVNGIQGKFVKILLKKAFTIVYNMHTLKICLISVTGKSTKLRMMYFQAFKLRTVDVCADVMV